MSKIALTPNASGSGTFTIAAPNSNTDRTLTLPDEAGTVLTSGRTGAVLQVVTGSTTTFLQKDSGDGWVATGIKATITPSSTSSKIVVLGSINGTGTSADSCRINFRLYRGGSSIADLYDGLYSNQTLSNLSASLQYEDSPSSTAALEYEFYLDVDNSGNAFLNNYASSQNTRSQITLMEIAG